MCCHVFLHSSSKRASAGEIVLVSHICAHARAHTETHGLVYEHMHTPFAGSCRNHMFYKNHGEGEERNMTSSDISISAIKDTTALKVSRCALRSKPQIYHRNYMNIPKYRNNANLFVLGGGGGGNICFALCLKISKLFILKQTVV